MRNTLQPARSLALLIFAVLSSGCSRGPGPAETVHDERVVSLAPSLTEIVWAIGAGCHLVGRTSACDYPPEFVKTVPVVGGFGKPSLDSVVMVSPTLVLEVDLEDERLGKLLERVGLRRERVRCSSLDDITAAIIDVGSYIGYEESARELAGDIDNRLAELRAGRDEKGPSVYVEIWGDPLMTVGRGSFVSELVSLAGGRNIGDEVADREYFSVSPEWVIARNPEVIVCLYMSDRNGIAGAVGGRIGWSGIKAVREQRVYGGLDCSPILRPGPRVLEGIEILRECIEGSGE